MAVLLFENQIWIVVCGLAAVILASVLLFSYRKPDQGQALIRSGFGGLRVSLSGLLSLPLVQKAEAVDITLTRLVIDQRGKNALICRDGTHINVKAAFFVRVKPTSEDIGKVVQTLGVKGASDVQVLHDVFSGRFIETLKKVSGKYDFTELSNREFFKQQVMSMLNVDSDGFVLDVVAIDELSKNEQDNEI